MQGILHTAENNGLELMTSLPTAHIETGLKSGKGSLSSEVVREAKAELEEIHGQLISGPLNHNTYRPVNGRGGQCWWYLGWRVSGERRRSFCGWER